MSNDKPQSGSDHPGETDSLSATGMFLRAFGEGAKADTASPDPLKEAPVQGPQRASAEPPAGAKAGPGEFTQLFQSLEAKPIAPASPRPLAEPQTGMGAAAAKSQPQAPAEQAGVPGEFTKIFVGGNSTPPASSGRITDESARPVPPPAQGASRGFSSPGSSGAASGEGSFTQIFSTPSPRQSNPPTPSSPRNSAWNDDPIFRPAQNAAPPEPASPSVTSLLSSLGTPGGSPAGRQAEPVPYRPETNPRSSPLASSEPSDASSGGVTRLIQRLAQTPVEPAPIPQAGAAATPAPPPANSGPGEFTRIISRGSAPAAEPPMPAAQAAAPAPAPASFALPAALHLPAAAPPAIPAAPRVAPPPMPLAPMPAAVAPKPPAVAAPALAPPKSKLEAMVPILLVINTFLLLIVLIVMIFLIKSR